MNLFARHGVVALRVSDIHHTQIVPLCRHCCERPVDVSGTCEWCWGDLQAQAKYER